MSPLHPLQRGSHRSHYSPSQARVNLLCNFHLFPLYNPLIKPSRQKSPSLITPSSFHSLHPLQKMDLSSPIAPVSRKSQSPLLLSPDPLGVPRRHLAGGSSPGLLPPPDDLHLGLGRHLQLDGRRVQLLREQQLPQTRHLLTGECDRRLPSAVTTIRLLNGFQKTGKEDSITTTLCLCSSTLSYPRDNPCTIASAALPF